MSALGEITAGVGGALVAQAWKVATILLAGLVLAVGASAGTGFWFVITARDQALRELAAERTTNADLRLSLGLQNSSLEVMAANTKAAGERRAVAERLAATAIKSAADRAVAAKASTATSCDAVLREAWGGR